jgi:nucleoside-diphosphate-sugar epimerase
MVAGGAGYVGSSLVPELLKQGHEVDVIDLLWFGNHLPAKTRIIERDVLDLTEQDLVGYDQVVFLAGLSNDPMADYSPARNYVFNGACPAYLAYVARRAGVRRFVYASSCSVYGYTPDKSADELSPPGSTYPYGISKLQGEMGVLQLACDDFSVIALRKGTVCGYSPRMRLDLVLNTMVAHATQSGSLTVTNPAIWRPVLSISDAVAAYLAALRAPAQISGIFNVASDNYMLGDLGAVVVSVLREMKGVRVTMKIESREDVRNYRVSTERASTILGWHAGSTAEDIVRDLVRHLPLFQDFGNPNYYNIRRFQALYDTVEALPAGRIAAAR